MANISSLERWDSAKSAELYYIHSWGNPYFSISPEGEVIVNVRGQSKENWVSLMTIVQGLKARGMNMPVLLRFSDILDSRIRILNETFLKAIKSCGYEGGYRGVFPIKVNQQQQVLEDISHFGAAFHHGLEAGSKAELIAAMAFMDDPEAFLICNGYKDEEFIDLALYSQKIGINCVIVVEMPGELDLIVKRSKALNVRPVIGVRVRLSAKAGGHWNASGGDHSMFGLNASQMIDMVDKLKEIGMLDCLKLLHYHLGSQIPNIRDIRNGVVEGCRIYAELAQEGAPMEFFDIGGGLAVDYDGSHTNYGSSCNYTLDEYCVDIIEVVMDSCIKNGLKHPTIISESGRATASYYSILLFNVLDVSSFISHIEKVQTIPDDVPELIKYLNEVRNSFSTKNLQECFNDAIYYRDEIRSAFLHGAISLRERAISEQLFWSIIKQIADETEKLKYVPDELVGLKDLLADIYYGNLSVFQSMPDVWAIDQLFPIMPIHRLNEHPDRLGIIADITCDCDGKINRFIGLHDVQNSLPLHSLKKGEEYILGAFLVGAYQETLGDLHNLMGDTNVVSIRVSPENEIEYTREILGDSVSDVLSYLEYDPKAMIDNIRRKAEKAVLQKLITVEERKVVMDAYNDGMRGYTYYER